MDSETGYVGDARDRGDDPARADPAHPSLVEVGQIEVAGAVEHELGRLVDSRLPRGAFVAGRAGHARAGEHGELARAQVEAKHLVAKAVRDVERGAARLEVVRQTQARWSRRSTLGRRRRRGDDDSHEECDEHQRIRCCTPHDCGRFPRQIAGDRQTASAWGPASGSGLSSGFRCFLVSGSKLVRRPSSHEPSGHVEMARSTGSAELVIRSLRLMTAIESWPRWRTLYVSAVQASPATPGRVISN